MKSVKELLSWVVPLAIGLVLALLIRQYGLTVVRIDGQSMMPNLINNERVLVLRQATIHRGSVIVFDDQGEDPKVTQEKHFVKRVIGLPGDTVSAENGVLKVNGQVVNQTFIPEQNQFATTQSNGVGNWTTLADLATRMNWPDKATMTVPAGQYFVMGDNRGASNDSRFFGYIPKRKVLGVVKLPFWVADEREANVNIEWKTFFE